MIILEIGSYFQLARFAIFSCDIFFETSAKLRNHNDVKHPTKPRVVCDKCGKDFGNDQHLKTHLIRVHQEFKITDKDRIKECENCSEEFSVSFDFNEHLKSCLNNLKFPVFLCSKSI